MNASLKCAVAAVGLALVSFAGAAAAERPPSGQVFERLDTNRDGKLDANEMENARAGQFRRLDANNDGVISASEQSRATDRIRRRAALREARMAERFEDMDTDGDQAISEDEFQNGARANRADTNNDGAVSREEFEAAAGSLRERRQRRN